MVGEHIFEIRNGVWEIPRKYWNMYSEDPREDQYYRAMNLIRYGEVWNTWCL